MCLLLAESFDPKRLLFITMIFLYASGSLWQAINAPRDEWRPKLDIRLQPKAALQQT